MKRNMSSRKVIAVVLAFLLTATFMMGCGVGAGSPNMPYEPDTPAPDPHNGVFVSDHGTMEFNGDGKTVIADFDSELAGLLGLPEGKQELTYVFLSGDLPPGGSVEVRYDVAHELRLSGADTSVVVDMAIVSEDGSTATMGIDTVTPERIPMFFRVDGERKNVIFTRDSNYTGRKDDSDSKAASEQTASQKPKNAFQSEETTQSQAEEESKSAEATELDFLAQLESDIGDDGVQADNTQTETGSFAQGITGADEDAAIEDFDWYFDGGFPGDGKAYKELWGLGGMWKSMIIAKASSDGRDMRRVVVSDTDVQYMGYKLTLLFHTKSRFEYSADAREDIQLVDNTQVTMTFEGDWDEERTSMDVSSLNSDLNLKIDSFTKKNGYDYAMGTAYNVDNEIGQVVMVRVTP